MPHCPRTVAFTMRALPLLPLRMALGHFAQCPSVDAAPSGRLCRPVGSDQPDRSALYAAGAAARGPRITAHRRGGALAADARIAGPVGMLHGRCDGDALLFSRDLTSEGDTEAVLALRNALDDAGLDLSEELAQMSGPLATPLRQILHIVERLTGLPLHRADNR
ncbi:MAG: sterol-binding protein [Paracoccus sp. (in: a-proteobacteria)]|nr:sterol-binding protein [Paracoccus sp. (in: a-proteobacteria)]